MNERIHRFLDGDLPADALSPAERARAAELGRALGAAAEAVRAAPVPELSARVMAALPAEGPRPPTLRAALAWLWRPRPVRLALRPAYGLALAGAATLAGVALPAGAPEPPASPRVYVQFRLEAAGAREVAVAGTFTGWRPTVALEPSASGVWTALVPLEPGVHDYVFVVDGAEWLPDPHAPQQVDDHFGGTNSRISLPPPNAEA